MKILTLGEVIMRFSSYKGIPLAEAREVAVNYVGSETNVAISLSNFGNEVALATILPDNDIGLAVRRHLQRYGVGIDNIINVPGRMGTCFFEYGAGIEADIILYDRKRSSFTLANDFWNFDQLFADVDLLHVSGITPTLSEKWSAYITELIEEAKKREVLINFATNYDNKLWESHDSGAYLRNILTQVDCCELRKDDIINLLKINANGENLADYYREVCKNYPNLSVVYSLEEKHIDMNNKVVQGFLYEKDQLNYSDIYEIPNNLESAGSRDVYSAGILHGLLRDWSEQDIVQYATAASVMKHFYYGEASEFSEKKVNNFLEFDDQVEKSENGENIANIEKQENINR